jgi:hypothetical protein
MAKAVGKSKARARWVAEIKAAAKETVAAVLKLGHTLTAAKQLLKELQSI